MFYLITLLMPATATEQPVPEVQQLLATIWEAGMDQLKQPNVSPQPCDSCRKPSKSVEATALQITQKLSALASSLSGFPLGKPPDSWWKLLGSSFQEAVCCSCQFRRSWSLPFTEGEVIGCYNWISELAPIKVEDQLGCCPFWRQCDPQQRSKVWMTQGSKNLQVMDLGSKVKHLTHLVRLIYSVLDVFGWTNLSPMLIMMPWHAVRTANDSQFFFGQGSQSLAAANFKASGPGVPVQRLHCWWGYGNSTQVLLPALWKR